MAQAIQHDTTEVSMKTSTDENSDAHETKLSIVWDSEKDARTFATRGVKIAAQAILRALGDIPAEYTVVISELAKRERGGFAMKPTPQNAQRMMAKLDDAQYAEALRGIGVNERDITRLVANRKTAPDKQMKSATVATGLGGRIVK